MPCRYGGIDYQYSEYKLQKTADGGDGGTGSIARPIAGFANQKQLDSIVNISPHGFHQLLQKIIAAVVLGRPVYLERFIAKFLDDELIKRTFGELECGCHLKKSLRPDAKHTASCTLLWREMDAGIDSFTKGPIPEYDIEPPAVDRYREYDQQETCSSEEVQEQSGDHVPCSQTAHKPPEGGIDQFMQGDIADCERRQPALDRYREMSADDGEIAGVKVSWTRREWAQPEMQTVCDRLGAMEGGVDQFMHGDIVSCELRQPALDRYRELSANDGDIEGVTVSWTRREWAQPEQHAACDPDTGHHKPDDEQKSTQLGGIDQFMQGDIVTCELDQPALDRYREMSANDGEIDGVSVSWTRREWVQPEMQEACRPHVDQPLDEPSPPPCPSIELHDLDVEAFTSGPIPECDREFPALDRYREWEGQEPCHSTDGEQCEYGHRLVEQCDSRVDGSEQREYSHTLLERRDSEEAKIVEQNECDFTAVEQRDCDGECDDAPCDDDGRVSQPDRTHYDEPEPEPEVETETAAKRPRDAIPRGDCKCTFCTFVKNQPSE